VKDIGIYYGSTTGQTAGVAARIGALLKTAAVHDIAGACPADLERHDFLVLGSSTWGVGYLQEDWARFRLDQVDLGGKTVALFGLGDAFTYVDTFVDGLGILYDAVTARGAAVIGAWAAVGYPFVRSAALREGAFVGLALDEDNQAHLTDERLSRWTAGVKRGR